MKTNIYNFRFSLALCVAMQKFITMKPKVYNLRILCLTLLLLIGAKSLHAQVDYLCFTADEAGYVSLSVTGNINADIQTSTDGINWTAYTFDTDINLATGNSVFFKGNYKGSINNYARFVMSGKIRASGNIMTLTDGNNPTLSLAGKDFCFNQLFYYCEALISAPELPATTLAKGCYFDMFNTCTSLMNAPVLPAETLAEECYVRMFQNCLSLTETPALPAKKLGTLCYNSMFANCIALTLLPELPATNLTVGCYHTMFKNCTGITLYEDGIGPTWGIPANAQPATEWNFIMLQNTGGTFTDNPEIGANYYYAPFPECLTFSSMSVFTITPSAVSWDGELFYSTDATNWNAFTIEGATAANNGAGEFQLYFRGKNNTRITGGNLSYWIIDADAASVACSGNIETLLDYTKVEAGEHPTMATICFANLFRNCTALSSAPELPATNLSDNCYVGMFRGCTELTVAPALPATTLTGGCYQEMFRGCTSLVQAPELKAKTLPPSCYKSMFMGCTALKTAPELPATTLGATCYQYMFSNCTSLTKAPTLQAMTMSPGCYYSMFDSCTSLTAPPELPAKTLAPLCYYQMFIGCTSIMLNTEEPGIAWSIPADADATGATQWNFNMFAETSGNFTGAPEIGTTYYLPAYDLWICGEQVTILNKDDLSVIDGVEGTVNYNPDTRTLTLNNATITAISGDAIGCLDGGINIELIGNNTVTSGGTAIAFDVLKGQAPGSIYGNGTLNASAGESGTVVYVCVPLTIKNCTVNAAGGFAGIWGHNNHKLIIDSATVSAIGTDLGSIFGFDDMELIGCAIVEPAGAVFDTTKHAICVADTIVKTEVKIMPFYTINFATPEHGTITVKQENNVINSGDNVFKESEITITATPDNGYKLKTLTVNGNPFESGNTHIVVADVNIVAEFVITGIEELAAQGINIYPNPVQDILYIEAKETVTAVNIYNMLGSIVAQNTGDAREINISNLPAGIYIVRIEMGESVGMLQIVKE